MNGFFYGVINETLNTLGQDVIFIILSACILIAFMINLFLCVFRVGYGLKKRLWQLAVSVFAVFFSKGIYGVNEEGIVLTNCIIGLSALLFVPILMIRERNFTVTEEQKNFVRFIDREIKTAVKKDDCASIKVNTLVDNESINCIADREIEKTAADFELDFQHVKNVIARLDYFGLKDSDKRQVKELESALLAAEKGDFDINVKSRINDGLGALLKIMSKYGA